MNARENKIVNPKIVLEFLIWPPNFGLKNYWKQFIKVANSFVFCVLYFSFLGYNRFLINFQRKPKNKDIKYV